MRRDEEPNSKVDVDESADDATADELEEEDEFDEDDEDDDTDTDIRRAWGEA